jgi:hypothetical protein
MEDDGPAALACDRCARPMNPAGGSSKKGVESAAKHVIPQPAVAGGPPYIRRNLPPSCARSSAKTLALRRLPLTR